MKLRTGVFVVEDIAYLYKKSPSFGKKVWSSLRDMKRDVSLCSYIEK